MNRNLARFYLTLMLALVFAGEYLRADDDVPSTKPEETEKKIEEGKEKPKPSEPSLLDKLSKELLKELDESPEQPTAEQREDKLDRAAKGMRTAGDRLGESQTDTQTRKVQEQVIRDLDDLIKQLQQPPPPNQGGGGGGGGGGSNRSGSGRAGAGGGGGGRVGSASGSSRSQRLKKIGEGQGSGQSSKQQMAGNSQKPGGKEKQQSESSDRRSESERKAAEEVARKKKLEMDVWGHLPPHLREQLLNTYGERMLPKYEKLVKQFYEALSEQNDSGPRR